jgi:hypothetical protein
MKVHSEFSHEWLSIPFEFDFAVAGNIPQGLKETVMELRGVTHVLDDKSHYPCYIFIVLWLFGVELVESLFMKESVLLDEHPHGFIA